MEEDHHHHQEYKHACKFCNKRFPCGRSLGGHMRSHLTNNSGETICRKKLKSVKNGGSCNMVTQGAAAAGYGLREHPKKTWRIADSSEETSAQDKLCKECGRGFVSWKALFGHMKCHSDKDRVSNNMSLEIQDSWKLVMDSQSDNETTAVPHRRRRRSRRTRCMAAAATTSSSVSEIEQEQEEVAICLMMLSRDVGHWDGLNFAAESSDNNSMLLEAQFSLQSSKINRIESKNYVCNGPEIVKSKKLSDKKLEHGNGSEMNVNEVFEDFEVELGKKLIKESEIDPGSGEFNSIKKKFQDSVVKFKKLSDKKLRPGKFEGRKSRNGSEMNTNEVFEDSEVVELEIKESEIDQVQLSSGKYNSIKRKFKDSNDPDQLRLDSLKKLTDAADSKISSKFECTTCNKVFHSYQALGGHRASHKKIKKGSKFDTIENRIEIEIYPNSAAAAAAAARKLPEPFNNDNPIDHEMHLGFDEKAESSYVSKKSKGHECPICLKVFPSGQALGGHKRSHFVVASEARNNQAVLIGKPVPEIRDMLDLNLPAPVEEESNANLGFRPWWIGGSHKHEALVGLISN